MNNIDFSSPAVIIGIAVAVLLIAAVIGLFVNLEKKRSERLRSRFGAEYDLTLKRMGSRKKAEEVLNGRIERIEHSKIHDLTLAQYDSYLLAWEVVQSRFIDYPRRAVAEADALVNSLLMARGFPPGDFDQRAADISVNHAMLVEPYRRAHLTAARAKHNQAMTEELRSAVIQYRTLFDALLETSTAPIQQQRKSA